MSNVGPNHTGSGQGNQTPNRCPSVFRLGMLFHCDRAAGHRGVCAANTQRATVVWRASDLDASSEAS